MIQQGIPNSSPLLSTPTPHLSSPKNLRSRLHASSLSEGDIDAPSTISLASMHELLSAGGWA